jgi:hypothetical protein
LGVGRGNGRGPYPADSLTYLYVSLSRATHIPFRALLEEDPRVIATYLEQLDDASKED